MVTKPYISLEGYHKLKLEISSLREIAADLVLRIKENRENETGDESDNTEMINLMSERESISEKFADLEQFLASCNVVDLDNLPDETKVVRFGTTVTLLDLDTDKKFTYKILGERESSLKDNIISYTSPLGKALMNEAVGNVVSFDAPKGERELEILSVKRQ